MEIKMLLHIKYTSAGYRKHGEGWGTEIRKVIFYLTIFWILHWFISRSGVVLGLWKLIYGSSEVR